MKPNKCKRLKKSVQNHINSLFYEQPIIIFTEASIQFAVCGLIFLNIPEDLKDYYVKNNNF